MSFLSNNPPAYDVLPKVRDIMTENLEKRGSAPVPGYLRPLSGLHQRVRHVFAVDLEAGDDVGQQPEPDPGLAEEHHDGPKWVSTALGQWA